MHVQGVPVPVVIESFYILFKWLQELKFFWNCSYRRSSAYCSCAFGSNIEGWHVVVLVKEVFAGQGGLCLVE